jgi:hypothetical protein
MKTIRLSILALVCVLAARADFSYTQTRKSAQGPAAAAGDQTTKHYFKGQKMKTESATTSTILDFDAQTITTINHAQKNYTVMKFSDMAQTMKSVGVDAKIDVKETGQRKSINGFNAAEVLMTMAMDSPDMAKGGMKMQMEFSMWLSPDVPGTQELRAFYQKNMDKFPWAAMVGGGGQPGMQKAMADMQKKMASLGGVPVLQVVRMKMAGNEAMNAQMQQAMAQMEAMRKQGGPGAAAAEKAMASMGGMGGRGGALFEMTTESSGFSTSAVADSVFALPDGYQKK